MYQYNYMLFWSHLDGAFQYCKNYLANLLNISILLTVSNALLWEIEWLVELQGLHGFEITRKAILSQLKGCKFSLGCKGRIRRWFYFFFFKSLLEMLCWYLSNVCIQRVLYKILWKRRYKACNSWSSDCGMFVFLPKQL